MISVRAGRSICVLIPGSSKRFLSSSKDPNLLWGPPSLIYSGYNGLFTPQVKRPDRGADHSLPSSAGLRMTEIVRPLFFFFLRPFQFALAFPYN
jgi:hypothetical protein